MQLHFARYQEGATLIVSLILLLVLTIVGISTIESVNLQSLMARNSQFQVESYQVALSEIEAQLEALEVDLGPLTDAVTEGTETRTGDDIVMQPDHFDQTVIYTYAGEGLPPPGYSGRYLCRPPLRTKQPCSNGQHGYLLRSDTGP